MRVVPRVIVHKYRAIGHCCDLIAVIPPRHHFGILKIKFARKYVASFDIAIVVWAVYHSSVINKGCLGVGFRDFKG